MLQIGLAPCSPSSVTRELMADSARLADQLDVRLQSKTGKSPVWTATP